MNTSQSRTEHGANRIQKAPDSPFLRLQNGRLTCPYCFSYAPLVGESEIYSYGSANSAKKFYKCTPCNAYVGCHPGTEIPLGSLANAELRKARSKAHAAFDPLWRNNGSNRTAAYVWLAKSLNISKDACHIGMFNLLKCERVVQLCNDRKKAPVIAPSGRPMAARL